MPRRGRENDQNARLVEVASNILFNFGYDVQSVANKILNREIEYVDDDFKAYSNRSGIIDENGIIRLCEYLGIKPDDVKLMAILYKMNCKDLKEINKSEWAAGFSAMNVTSLIQLKNSLAAIYNDLKRDDNDLKNFLVYCFDKMRGNIRKLDRSSAEIILNLVIPDRPYVQDFIKFLNEKDISYISLDLWKMFFAFSNQFADSLSEFDAEGAWPSQIDEFVVYLKSIGRS